MSPEPRRLPLLRLRRKGRVDKAGKGGGPGRPPRRPTPSRQIERLGPKFERLESALEHRRAELREELAGVEPEMALVLEIVGTVTDFVNAVKKTELEWLGEFDADLLPDEEFYKEQDRTAELGGSLYLVMTDRRALDELLSLWKRWRRAPEKKFPYGWRRWQRIFERLRDIRPWSAVDRLRETGLAEMWRERLAEGDEEVRTEIELWFRDFGVRRQRAEDLVRRRVVEAGGRVIGQSTAIREIAYHGLLAEIPAQAAEQILGLEEVALLHCDDVMFFRPVGQTGAPVTDEELGPEKAAPPPGEDAGEPVIAVLDGLPLEQHHHLTGRLVVDDPDGWGAEIPAVRRRHGTAIATLILHGDLGGDEPPLEGRIYVRPVLKPDGLDARWEGMPHDTLAVDLIHRGIRRLFGDEGVAPGVMVVNLSIGDRSRPFDHLVSPFARLIDWLAWEHKLLVVVSAGNHPEPIDLNKKASELDPEERQREFWRVLKDKAHLQRILAPAEAINALTVGAEHRDACRGYELGLRIDAAANGDGEMLPSPITGWGPGPDGAMKPDLFFPGGRQLYVEEPGNRLRPSHARAKQPGQQVAAPATPPDLGRTCYEIGTSNAAALASRTAGQLLAVLPEIVEGFDPPLDRRFLAPLLKAFVAHGAAWGPAKELCEALLETDERKHLGRFLGFGFVDPARVLGCTDQRITLVAWGMLGKEQADLYTVPLPYALSGVGGARRLVTTLAWLSPINPRDRRYRKADLWVSPDSEQFDLERDLGVQRRDADYRAAMRGTLHHEVWEGSSAAAFAETDEMVFKVNCREHARQLVEPIPYGLLVTLEVAPELGVEIYNEVRTKVRAWVRV